MYNHNKHSKAKTMCIFLGIYRMCISVCWCGWRKKRLFVTQWFWQNGRLLLLLDINFCLSSRHRFQEANTTLMTHDDVIQWKHFPCYWPFVRGIHRSPENSPHKGQWRRALMFSLICASVNAWVNNLEAGDLRCHRAHYDVSVMEKEAMVLGPRSQDWCLMFSTCFRFW